MAIVINSLTPTNPSTQAGSSITFVVDAIETGGATLSYEWQFSQDGNIYSTGGLVNNTNATYTTSNLTSNQDGLYFRVAVSDGVSTVFSNEYPGIGDRIISVFQNPSIVALVDSTRDFYPNSYTASVGETVSFTASASLTDADISNTTLVSNIVIQWQYSIDDGSNWIDITSGGNVSISNNISGFGTTPETYYKYSTLQISNITFDYNLYLYRAIISFDGAVNTPVTLSNIVLLVDPQINVYRNPGEGDDTTEFRCYKTSDSSTGRIKLQVGALSTANTTLSYQWEFSLNGGGFWIVVDTFVDNDNCILKPGTSSNSDVLELERFIFYDPLDVRCVISGISGEATVISNTHRLYSTDIEVSPILSNTVYDVVEDRYGDIPDRSIYQDEVRNVFLFGSVDVYRNTGLNGDVTLNFQRQDPGSSTWYDVGGDISNFTSDNIIQYTDIPLTTSNEFVESEYSSPPLRVSIDDGAKYRLKVTSTALFTRNGSVKTLIPYFSDEILLNVYRTIYIINQPSDTSVIPNTNASFGVSATVSSGDNVDITYQWQYNTQDLTTGWVNIPNSAPYSGVNTASLQISSVSASPTYRFFRCVMNVSNSLSSVTTRVARLSITRDLFTFIPSLNDYYLNEFDILQWSVSASTVSNQPVSYQWQKSTDYNRFSQVGTWTNIAGATSNSYQILSVAESDAGFYRVRMTSFGGEVVNSNAAYVDVTNVDITVTQNIPTSITVTEGIPNAYFFSCAGISSLGGAIEYQWQKSLPYTPISGTTYTVGGETYTINGTSYPVNGLLYIPDIPATSVDVIVMYHGTISSQTETIMQAAQTALDIALSDTQINLKDKIIFSVAYPQDAIPAANQFGIGGNEDPNFLFGDNLPYARASLLWAKNNLNGYMSGIAVSKTINRVFTFGHSQGGSLVHKLNTLEQVDGVIMNAPGPIKLDLTCYAEETTGNLSTTCQKLINVYGSAFGSNRQEYIDRSVISYNDGLLSEMLFIQGQQDTAGAGNQVSWLEDLLDLILANSATNADYTYLPVFGQHYAIATSTVAQEAVRNFVSSNAPSADFVNIGAGVNGSPDNTNQYAPLPFDRITQNLSRIRCKLSSNSVPFDVYTNECTVNVNRIFTYFADVANKNVTIGSSFSLNLNATWTGGTPEFSWEESTNGGSSFTPLNETSQFLFIPTIDASYNGRIYRCLITLDGCNKHTYTRGNVTTTVDVSPSTYTVSVRLNAITAATKASYYSLERQKTGAAIGTVICVAKPADYVENNSSTGDDVSRWNVAVSGSLSSSSPTSVITSGGVYNANKPSWAPSTGTNAYTSPSWLLREDRFKGYLEMRGQYLRAVDFPELARMFGSTFGGNVPADSYPNYNSTHVFRMPNLYAKRLMGTGNIDNTRGAVSITPEYDPNGSSGGDKNVPGTIGGRYNYTTSAQLPPGSPGISGQPDGTAGQGTDPIIYSLGSFTTSGINEASAFVQPSLSGTVTYSTPAPAAEFTDTPLHSHRGVSVAFRQAPAAITSGECRGTTGGLADNRFPPTRQNNGVLRNAPDGAGQAHPHGVDDQGPGSFDMVADAGMTISDTTIRLSGQSTQIFNNNLAFFLRNNSDIPLNSPYFRLKYLIKAY